MLEMLMLGHCNLALSSMPNRVLYFFKSIHREMKIEKFNL